MVVEWFQHTRITYRSRLLIENIAEKLGFLRQLHGLLCGWKLRNLTSAAKPKSCQEFLQIFAGAAEDID
jgi:hypothetical protein